MQRSIPLRDDRFDNSRATEQVDVKEMAVRMILTREVSRAQLAKDLGVGQATLTHWVRDAIDNSPFGDVLGSLHEEVGVLRKEKALLQKVLRTRNRTG
jgi:transposase-like protein